MAPETELDGRLYRWDLSLTEVGGVAALSLRFVNQSGKPLWLPMESAPAYRIDVERRQVVMSYGYFEDVYGSHRDRYMVPPMREIGPNERWEWTVAEAKIVESVAKNGFEPVVRSRAALKPIPFHRVRGSQPLDAYLEASAIVKSNKLVR